MYRLCNNIISVLARAIILLGDGARFINGLLENNSGIDRQAERHTRFQLIIGIQRDEEGFRLLTVFWCGDNLPE